MKRESTLTSVKWNAINSVVSQATTIITGIVLMRLLDPSAFGLIGMITVFTGFLNILKDGGLASSLIYQLDLEQTDKDTIFWFNFCIGILLTFFLFFSSGFIAQYYGEPILDNLAKAFSFTFILSSLSTTHYTLLKKKLAFKKIFQVEIIGLLISAALTIIASYLGFGVWSLVVLHLSRNLLITINTYFISEYSPSLQFSFKILKKHFKYSLPVFGTKSFNYWTQNADNFFIGSFLGSQALGYYSRAFFFVTLPTNKISSIIGNVLFPSLSIIKNDKLKAASLYLKAMNMTSFITFPLLGGLLVLAEPFTRVAFGNQWLPMVLTLQILCVLSLLKSVFDFTTTIFFSQGATSLHFKISMLQGIINILAFYFASQYSIEMVAMLLLFVFAVFLFVKTFYASKLVDLNVVDIFGNIRNVFLINGVCIICTYFLVVYINSIFTDTSILILVSLFYIVLFGGLNLLFNKKELNAFLQIILKLIRNK